MKISCTLTDHPSLYVLANRGNMLDLSKDPILAKWKANFTENFTVKLFDSDRSRPFNFLINNNHYDKKPFVLVAAGPSLDKNLAYLKDYQDKCVIICAEVILFKLIENGIRPDYVVTIDPSEQFTRFLAGIDTADMTYICPTTVHPSVASVWKGKFVFFSQEDAPGSAKEKLLSSIAIPGWTKLYNSYFVGATMYQIAQLLNASSIALVGYDFAYTDNKAYCDGFLERKIYDDTTPEGSPEWLENIARLKEQEISKDYYVTIGDAKIYTTQLFHLYKMTLLQLIFKYKKLIFNCTEGGIFTEISQLPLKAFCSQFCTTTFSKPKGFTFKKRR